MFVGFGNFENTFAFPLSVKSLESAVDGRLGAFVWRRREHGSNIVHGHLTRQRCHRGLRCADERLAASAVWAVTADILIHGLFGL